MFLKFLSKSKSFVAAMALSLLAGCGALAPGMHAGMTPAEQPTGSGTAPEVKLITPDLLQAEKKAREARPGQDIDALIAEPTPYTIGSGDILSIVVWDHPELGMAAAPLQVMSTPSGLSQAPAAPGFVVDHAGYVQFPYIGPVKLAGLTELQARDLLAEKLIKAIKKPDVTVRVASFRSKRVYIDGDVKNPGSQLIDDVPMTLLEGVARAGGFLPSADQSNIWVNRRGTSYRVNLPELVADGVDPSRIMLAPNDVVRVVPAAENKVHVLGEVTTPKALTMNNGRLTLSQALGEVGGLNPLSSAGRQVYVIRNMDDGSPVVYNLDAKSPLALALADNFELQAKDVVYVDASSLARYNRIISLIIPSATAATTVRGLQ